MYSDNYGSKCLGLHWGDGRLEFAIFLERHKSAICRIPTATFSAVLVRYRPVETRQEKVSALR